MAGSSLLTLIDDIATILDDVALMTKVAAKKTAGVLGDDLALNAEQVNGVRAERELPVVWGVAKGSFVNKCILVPAALAISAVLPWAITPLLMFGGAFLCFEGFEKIAHKFLHANEEDSEHEGRLNALANPEVDIVAFEREKVKGAIRTDFILSAEIITITLGTVAEASFMKQVVVLTGIGLLMTVGVYGLVAGIVKLDDAGFYLSKQPSAVLKKLGRGLILVAPKLMKMLSVVGTAAMFTVGGGILTHGIPPVHHAIEGAAHAASGVPGIGGLLAALIPTTLNALFGVLTGILALLLVTGAQRAYRAVKKQPA
ncbi:DUF808 domain-containing protein [Chondromyces apiculatus]|uniref:Membrane protein, putative n=1 Tax=Chondromyces apiculatus DSM 436 TaxID=1192034 RepID=A0A017T139_9BACT|nr:DUF808 domain-containing protein [Chondromyces apiculatus]EYF02281.1 Membrane protein, putative [Chondromyces apiculatus DSM 436]